MLLAMQGAQLLLLSSPPAARHVIYAAFERQGRGKQLVSTLSLFLISLFLFFVALF